MAMEKFTPTKPELPDFTELDLLAEVTESDLWEAVNDWLENMKDSEFEQLVNAEING